MGNCSKYFEREPNIELANKLKWVIWLLCVVVFILVGMMRSEHKFEQFADYTQILPPVHAILNTGVAVFLITALAAVKLKRICLHKACVNFAMMLSILFLLCYVSYHFTNVETLFGDFDKNGEVTVEEKAMAGGMRTAYFLILISHIVLAAVSLPMILFTWLYGITNQFGKHRKLAKITFPIWLYVAVTGPVCYFMLKPFY